MRDKIVKYKLVDKEGFIKEQPHYNNKIVDNDVNEDNLVTGVFEENDSILLLLHTRRCIYEWELEEFFEEAEPTTSAPTQKKLNIPWYLIKDNFNYCAMDEDGDVRVFENKPFPNSTNWQDESGKWEYLSKILEIDIRGINWKESLCERPIIFKDSVCYKLFDGVYGVYDADHKGFYCATLGGKFIHIEDLDLSTIIEMQEKQ